MLDLFQGVRNFREKVFPGYAETFRLLNPDQKPHALFITCNDSRVDPNLITSSGPGELFVIRTIANIVPEYTPTDTVSETAAAVAYAVEVLQVPRIVVCGHSHCGGCEALQGDSGHVPTLTHRWLLDNAGIGAATAGDSASMSGARLEQANVVLQLARLRSYPGVALQEEHGAIELLGWYYDMAAGIVYNYSSETGEFLPL